MQFTFTALDSNEFGGLLHIYFSEPDRSGKKKFINPFSQKSFSEQFTFGKF